METFISLKLTKDPLWLSEQICIKVREGLKISQSVAMCLLNNLMASIEVIYIFTGKYLKFLCWPSMTSISSEGNWNSSTYHTRKKGFTILLCKLANIETQVS